MEIAIQIIAGLALLALGGEGVIRGAVGVARRLGLSELLIGLTLVGFGTSSPELITSIDAALVGSPGIALGNVIGSNIGNILLILALVLLIKPIAVNPAAVGRDGVIALVVSIGLAALALTFGELNRMIGLLLLAGLAVYVFTVWRIESRGGAAAEVHVESSHTHAPAPQALWVSALFVTAGLGLLMLGANLLVTGAVATARIAGLSETVIGLTIVAIGTSLPELVATLAAALKGRSDVAFGNIVGSNIYNILGILGLTALIHPLPIPKDVGLLDWGALIGSAALLLVFALTGRRLTRLEGVAFLAAYAAFVYLLLSK
ncbi:calcium/sodium antiporter [Phenylobacterium sp.]|uniref:calcium/sodium antiporter n=1 Tax=Phenylobacterium sp. TaxID=1871053 RepID=UPI002FDEDB6D